MSNQRSKYIPEYIKRDIKPIIVNPARDRELSMKRIPFIPNNNTNDVLPPLTNKSSPKTRTPSIHSKSFENPLLSERDLEQEEKEINNMQFTVDDIRSSQSDYDEVENIELEQIDPSSYFLILNNNIIYNSFSLDEVEEVIENLLFKQKACKAKDLMVFKKLDLKIGISIK